MLTEREAIREAKKLWAEIAESGLSKDQFFWLTSKGEEWHKKGYKWDCPLCEYVGQAVGRYIGLNYCMFRNPKLCPLIKQYSRTCVGLHFDRDPRHFNTRIQMLREPGAGIQIGTITELRDLTWEEG